MKININDIKITPSNLPFNFCVFGKPNEHVQKWINHWSLQTEDSGKFTNIILPDDLDIAQIFEQPEPFTYMDGFSPNLNKHLHVGHLSNLIIASALYNLELTKNTICILGDTLDGEVESEDAYNAYLNILPNYNYPLSLDNIYYASHQKYEGDLLKEGTGDYEGCKVFEIDEQKLVGIKSTGASSYFYQDVALATKLNAPTLYLTGFEQNGHFTALNKLFPNNSHIGLGLLMVDGKKMSSSEGNVIMAQEMIDQLNDKFEDPKVGTNVLIGQILKSQPTSIKKIVTKDWDNPKTSPGLYTSYTLARLISAGMTYELSEFNSVKVKFAYLKSKANMSPNILFESLISLSKEINSLYMNHIIKDNAENQAMFQPMINDLALGMKYLGMHLVNKV